MEMPVWTLLTIELHQGNLYPSFTGRFITVSQIQAGEVISYEILYRMS